jgi:hypothetical protein
MEPYGWILLIITVILILFSIIRRIFPKYLSLLISNFSSCYEASRNYKLKNTSYLTSSILLWSIFFLNIGLLSFFSIQHFLPFTLNYPSIVYILLFSGIFFLGYIAKLIVYYLIGVLVHETNITKEYIFSWNTISKVVGLGLSISTFTIGFINNDYRKILIIIGISLYLLGYLYRLYRGLCIIRPKKFFYLYILLYFCTVELIPIIVLLFSMNKLLLV